MATHLKKDILTATEAVERKSEFDDIWTRYKASGDVKQAFINACGFTNLETEAVDAEAEAARAAAAEKVASKADKPACAAEAVKKTRAAKVARDKANKAKEETDKFLEALKKAESAIETPVQDLKDVLASAETAHDKTKEHADKADEFADEADEFADEAAALDRRSYEAGAIRTAADESREAADNAAAQLVVADAELASLRGIIRSNGAIAQAKVHESNIVEARDAAAGFVAPAERANKRAAKALRDLKRRLGGTGGHDWLTWLKSRVGTLVSLVIALIATLFWLYFDAPGITLVAMGLVILGVGLWTGFGKGDSFENRTSASLKVAVLLAVFAVVANFALYWVGHDSSDGNNNDNTGNAEKTTEVVDCWLAKYQNHPDCQP